MFGIRRKGCKSVVKCQYRYDETLYEPVNPEDVVIRSVADVLHSFEKAMELSDFVFLTRNQDQVEYIASETLLKHLPDYYGTGMMMLISDCGENVNIIINKMEDSGYHMINKSRKRDRIGRGWILIAFNPLNKHPFTTDIKGVYFYVGLTTKSDDYVMMMKSISDNLKQKGHEFAGDFLEYEILLKKLPADMEFHYDPNAQGKDFCVCGRRYFRRCHHVYGR